MKRLHFAALAAIAFGAAGVAARPRPPASRVFTSASAGVTMRYPVAWRPIAPDADMLSLVRPAMISHGPIQPRGQARIMVAPSAAPARAEEAVIRYYGSEGMVGPIDRIDLPGAGTPCSHLARATVREDVVPPENRTVKVRDIVTTILVCSTPATVIVGTASTWADDPQASRARSDLLLIMRSLRSIAGASPKPRP